MNGKIYTIDAFVENQVTNYFHIQCQQHTPPFDDSVWDYQGGPVPEETSTHSHPSLSSDILYQLPPATTIHSILLVQVICLTVLFHNLSSGPLWSTSWSGILCFILHTQSLFFSQNMPILSQPVLL